MTFLRDYLRVGHTENFVGNEVIFARFEQMPGFILHYGLHENIHYFGNKAARQHYLCSPLSQYSPRTMAF